MKSSETHTASSLGTVRLRLAQRSAAQRSAAQRSAAQRSADFREA